MVVLRTAFQPTDERTASYSNALADLSIQETKMDTMSDITIHAAVETGVTTSLAADVMLAATAEAGETDLPVEGPRQYPSADLQAIVADAKAFEAEFYKPALKAHSEADAAYMEAPKDAKPDYARIEALEDAYNKCGDAYTSKVLEILKLPASSPAELLTNAATCAELLTHYLADRINARTNHGKLIRDHQELLLDYVMSGLEDLSKPSVNIAALADQLEAENATNTPGSTDRQWDHAVACIEAAATNLKAMRAALSDAEAAVEIAAPMPEILVIDRNEAGEVSRSYFSEEAIERDFDLPHHIGIKAQMLAALSAWTEATREAERRYGIKRLAEATDAAFEAWRAAYYVISELSPPDAVGLALKARIMLLSERFGEEYGELTGEHLDEMSSVQGADFAAAQIYKDIVSLADRSEWVVGRDAIRKAWQDARLAALKSDHPADIEERLTKAPYRSASKAAA